MERNELLKIAKPIIFNTNMVRAIFEGRKTQTRRPFSFVMKDGRNPDFSGYSLGEYCTSDINSGAVLYSRHSNGSWTPATERVLPKYKVGDILYVREKFYQLTSYHFNYYADYPINMAETYKWQPSIHMPKDAARLFLKVTGVRVERLRTITEEDARAEGVLIGRDNPGCGNACVNYKTGFSALWDIIYTDKRYYWDSNPWVWVYTFEKIA